MSFTCQISTKVCSACGETKPESEYYSKTSRHGRVGLASECKSCAKARAARWAADNPDKVRKKNRDWVRKQIGCAPEDYDRMYEEQGGCCGICRLPFDMLCVDHCHETGRIRGLLCTTCNKSLGGFKDDKERLQRAIDWLLADH